MLKKKKEYSIIAAIIGSIGIIIAAFITIYPRLTLNDLTSEKRSIEITFPSCGSNFKCEKIENGKCYFNVKGTSKNIKKTEYISLMLKIGGGAWWQGGHSVSKVEFEGNNWEIYMASIDVVDITLYFIAKVIVTQNPLPIGENYQVLPNHFAESKTCRFRIE